MRLLQKLENKISISVKTKEQHQYSRAGKAKEICDSYFKSVHIVTKHISIRRGKGWLAWNLIVWEDLSKSPGERGSHRQYTSGILVPSARTFLSWKGMY